MIDDESNLISRKTKNRIWYCKGEINMKKLTKTAIALFGAAYGK